MPGSSRPNEQKFTPILHFFGSKNLLITQYFFEVVKPTAVNWLLKLWSGGPFGIEEIQEMLINFRS